MIKNTILLKKLYWDKKIIIILALIAAILLFSNSFEMKISPLDKDNHLSSSLDISWAIAQNFANFHNLIWGKDFIFTHGPLSPLALRITWGESKIAFLLFDIFYFVNIFLVVYLSLKNNNKLTTLLTVISVICLFPSFLGGSFAIVFFFILIFWIIKSLENPKTIFFINQTVLLILLFYIKFNTGLISFVLYFSMIGYLLYTKKLNYKKAILFSIFPFVLILLTTFLFKVSLFEYIFYGFEMVSGYNEIMYIRELFFESELRFALSFIFISILILLIKFFTQKGLYLKNLLTIFIYSTAIFVLYKQAYVRGDIGHINGFFTYSTFLILCTGSFLKDKIFKFSNLLLIPLFVIPIYHNYEEVKNNIKALSLDKSEYFIGLKNCNTDFANTLYPNNNQLPDEIINEIGNKTIDVYPWDIMLLLENKLNYQPRPIIQSYSAYTKDLESLNFNLYNSNNAPEYVIYDYETIDNRYPLFDESKVNLALKLNYEPITKFNFSKKDLILFKRKKDFKPIKFELVNEFAILLDSPLVPKENYFYEVELYNSFSGKVYSLLLNSPELNINIKTNNNQIITHKISNSLLKSGIFSEQYYKTTNDFFDSFSSNDFPKTNIIKGYYFVPKNTDYFKSKVKVKEYKITQ